MERLLIGRFSLGGGGGVSFDNRTLCLRYSLSIHYPNYSNYNILELLNELVIHVINYLSRLVEAVTSWRVSSGRQERAAEMTDVQIIC